MEYFKHIIQVQFNYNEKHDMTMFVINRERKNEDILLQYIENAMKDLTNLNYLTNECV